MARKKSTSEPSRNSFLIFAVFVAVLFTFSTPTFASSFLRLNHEFLQARNLAIDLIDTMSAVRETLMTANSILPIRVRLMDGNNFNGDKFYKDMLAKKSSDEIFQMFFDFLTEDENNGISGALKNIAAQNGTKFRIYWLWLYPTDDGLSCVRQEDMTKKQRRKFGTHARCSQSWKFITRCRSFFSRKE